MYEFDIKAVEANSWWQKTRPVGALMNNLMLLFIFVPIGLVIKQFYTLSFLVFCFMVPYGFLVRHLAVRAVRNYLACHPEALDEFESSGILNSQELGP